MTFQALPIGQSTKANSVSMTLASDQGNLPVNMNDSTGVALVGFPAGFLMVTDQPKQLYYDPFDATFDLVNRWNAPVSGNGGVAAAVANGAASLASGTLANGYSYISSIPSFLPVVPAWLGVSFANKFETPITSTTYRFWGLGTNPAIPTAAAPLTNAVGFELYTDGKMYCVIYAAGVRTVIQDLSAATGNGKQPIDANYHRFIIYYRTDRIYFYIDTLATAVGTSNFQAPNIQTLPVLMMAVNGTGAPAASAVLTSTGLSVFDSGKNTTKITDATYGHRGLQVLAGGQAAVRLTDTNSNALSVAMSNVANLVSFALNGIGTTLVNIYGVWTGTLIFEGIGDATNGTWQALYAQNVTNTFYTQYFTANATFKLNTGGYTQIRVRCSVVGTGTANVSFNGSGVASMVSLSEPMFQWQGQFAKAGLGKYYIVSTAQLVAAAASNLRFTISNPAASGVTVYIDYIVIYNTLVGYAAFVLTPTTTLPAAVATVQNGLIGGGIAKKAVVSADLNATAMTGGTAQYTGFVQANTRNIFQYKPFLLPQSTLWGFNMPITAAGTAGVEVGFHEE